MTDRFEEDMMEDLLAEPGHSAMDAMDEADEFDSADEFDEGDEFEAADEFEAGDEFDEMEEGDEFDEGEGADEFEEAMTDALEAADEDEFWGSFGKVLKKIGRGVGSVARVVAPIASAIPIPQAQMIGKAAGLIGNVLADEGDEMDAFEELADYAEEEDALDALAPAIATIAIRHGLKKQAAALPRVARRQLVKTVTAATRHIARRHGPRALAALPVIVGHARRIAVRRRLPARQLPHLVARGVRTAIRSPRHLRRYIGVAARLRGGVAGRIGHRHGHRGRRHGLGLGTGVGPSYGPGGGRLRHRRHGIHAARGGVAGGPAPVCTSCGRSRRSLRFGGPVRVTIESV
jgi:hypothetical protein